MGKHSFNTFFKFSIGTNGSLQLNAGEFQPVDCSWVCCGHAADGCLAFGASAIQMIHERQRNDIQDAMYSVH